MFEEYHSLEHETDPAKVKKLLLSLEEAIANNKKYLQEQKETVAQLVQSIALFKNTIRRNGIFGNYTYAVDDPGKLKGHVVQLLKKLNIQLKPTNTLFSKRAA